jgi:tRNA U34 2-thiouridine synthase MnmA/TrmU
MTLYHHLEKEKQSVCFESENKLGTYLDRYLEEALSLVMH